MSLEAHKLSVKEKIGYSLGDLAGKAVDNGLALHVDDLAWAEKQMWAPDAAQTTHFSPFLQTGSTC